MTAKLKSYLEKCLISGDEGEVISIDESESQKVKTLDTEIGLIKIIEKSSQLDQDVHNLEYVISLEYVNDPQEVIDLLTEYSNCRHEKSEENYFVDIVFTNVNDFIEFLTDYFYDG
jgi:hypothetical protein